MIEQQDHITVELIQLEGKVKELFDQGYRLVQISCTKLDQLELSYSFDKDYKFVNLKLTVGLTQAKVPSISRIFWSAFLYENEIHDLFGISFENMVIDYKGNFYQLNLKTPFNIPADKQVSSSGPQGGNQL